MTHWYKLKCEDCNVEQDSAFVIYNGRISLYPIDEGEQYQTGQFLSEHSGHRVVVLQD
jgi:hypothetical protein